MARVFLSPGKKNVELFLKKWFFKIEKKTILGTYVRSQKIEARGTRQIDVRSDFWCEKKIDPLPLRNLGRKNSTKNRKIKYKKIN